MPSISAGSQLLVGAKSKAQVRLLAVKLLKDFPDQIPNRNWTPSKADAGVWTKDQKGNRISLRLNGLVYQYNETIDRFQGVFPPGYTTSVFNVIKNGEKVRLTDVSFNAANAKLEWDAAVVEYDKEKKERLLATAPQNTKEVPQADLPPARVLPKGKATPANNK